MSWPRSLRRALGLQPLRFAMVGLANTAVGLAAIYFAKLALGLGDVAANAAGYALGLLIAYILNASWTFGYRGRVAAAAGRFLGAFLLSYAVNLATVWYLIHEAALDSYLAQAAGILPYTLCFYLLCRWFVFREEKSGGRTALSA